MYQRKLQKEKIFINRPYAVTDSVWVVAETALNKPITGLANPTSILIDFYRKKAKQEMPMSNQTGIAFVKFDPELDDWLIQLRQILLKTGYLNADLNEEILERIISDNSSIAGGLTMMAAINHQIIIPNNPMGWRVTDFAPFRLKDIKQKNNGGSFHGITNVEYGELSFDSSNNQSLLALLFGMPPR